MDKNEEFILKFLYEKTIYELRQIGIRIELTFDEYKGQM